MNATQLEFTRTSIQPAVDDMVDTLLETISQGEIPISISYLLKFARAGALLEGQTQYWGAALRESAEELNVIIDIVAFKTKVCDAIALSGERWGFSSWNYHFLEDQSNAPDWMSAFCYEKNGRFERRLQSTELEYDIFVFLADGNNNLYIPSGVNWLVQRWEALTIYRDARRAMLHELFPYWHEAMEKFL